MPRDDKSVSDQTVALPLLQAQRLYKQIAEVLEERIHSGMFRARDYLPPERDLAKQMGVSRTSVREALIALEVKGLVTIRVGDGVQVCEPGPAPVVVPDLRRERSALEQLQARCLIEGELAALAAKNATDEHIQKLEQALDLMHRSFPDSAVFLEADHAFHLAMGEAAGNQVLMDHLELLWALRYQPTFKKFEEHYTNDHGEQLAVLEDHRRIVDAIRSRNARQARTALHQHLKRVQKLFVR